MTKNSLKPVALSVHLLLAAMLLASGINAEAKPIWRKVKNVANSASDAVVKSANTIASTSSSEMGALSSTAKSAYASSAQDVTAGYNESVKVMNSALQMGILALYKEAAQKMLNKNRDKTVRMAAAFRNLDDEGLNALNRIVDAISNKRIDDTVKNDLLVIARKLSLLDNGANLPDGLANSNFGISLDNTAGLGVGAGQSIGIGMDLSPTNGRYRVAIVQGQSVSSGLQADISSGVSMFWSPGSINDSEGSSVGLAVELALEGGAGVGMSWGVGLDITKISPVPGLSLALVGGVSVKADLVGGYTWIVQKFQIPPAPNTTKTIGSNGGTPWTDSPKCIGQLVTGFRVNHGNKIDGIQFKYGSRGWAEPHGKGPFPVEVLLAPGEYINNIAQHAGRTVETLIFSTNFNHSRGPYGKGKFDPSYLTPTGEGLSCVSGRSGDLVDQLTFTSSGSN